VTKQVHNLTIEVARETAGLEGLTAQTNEIHAHVTALTSQAGLQVGKIDPTWSVPETIWMGRGVLKVYLLRPRNARLLTKSVRPSGARLCRCLIALKPRSHPHHEQANPC
jgi:hypothetical protein